MDAAKHVTTAVCLIIGDEDDGGGLLQQVLNEAPTLLHTAQRRITYYNPYWFLVCNQFNLCSQRLSSSLHLDAREASAQAFQILRVPLALAAALSELALEMGYSGG